MVVTVGVVGGVGGVGGVGVVWCNWCCFFVLYFFQRKRMKASVLAQNIIMCFLE